IRRLPCAAPARRWLPRSCTPTPSFAPPHAPHESFSTPRGSRLSGIGAPGSPGSVLADLDPREAADCGTAPQGFDELSDRRLRVADERLLEKDHVLVEAVEPPLDDLRERVLGLAFVAAQLLEHLALLGDDVAGDIVAGEVARRRRRDVQREVVRHLLRPRITLVDTGDLDEHADRAPAVLHVLVAVEHAVGALEDDDATEGDVLPEPRG